MIYVFFLIVAICLVVVAYILGANRNIRRPEANHTAMARVLQALIEQDNNFPLLPKQQKEEAEQLLDDYYGLPKQKEIN